MLQTVALVLLTFAAASPEGPTGTNSTPDLRALWSEAPDPAPANASSRVFLRVSTLCARGVNATRAGATRAARAVQSLPLEAVTRRVTLLSARASSACLGALSAAKQSSHQLQLEVSQFVVETVRRRRAALAAARRKYWRRDRTVSRVLRMSKAQRWYQVLQVRRSAKKRELKEACAPPHVQAAAVERVCG